MRMEQEMNFPSPIRILPNLHICERPRWEFSWDSTVCACDTIFLIPLSLQQLRIWATICIPPSSPTSPEL